jgi:hypothetical protein
MLTKKDIQMIREALVQDFKKVFLEEGKKIFATKEELQEVRIELKNDIQLLKEDVLLFKDEILGEVKAMREELTIVVGYRQYIEDHDERISALERGKYVIGVAEK